MFPTSIPSFTNPISTETLAAAGHTALHILEISNIIALANKLGTGASTPTTGTFLAANGTGTSTWRSLTSSDVGFSPLTILQQVYPVGCIYAETTGVNPSVTFGFGSWVATATGKVLIGAGTSDQAFVAGATGGESNHTLVSNEMPSHNHGITDPGHNHTYNFNNSVGGITAGSSVGSNTPALNTSTNTTGITVNNTGGSAAHNNLQPYQVIFYWERTA